MTGKTARKYIRIIDFLIGVLVVSTAIYFIAI